MISQINQLPSAEFIQVGGKKRGRRTARKPVKKGRKSTKKQTQKHRKSRKGRKH